MKKTKEQKEMFDNIIGYDDIKGTLKTVVDMLNNEEKYKELGCNLVHGLILYGPPGTGKTTIANEIIDNTINRKVYTIRKNKSDGSFINYMTKIFKEAQTAQPSLILLDDLDKFAEIEVEKKKNKEEHVSVQTLIDSVKDDDVFIIATANDYYDLPYSLRRSGRFDIKLSIDNPTEEDAKKIFSYYLKDKKVNQNINIDNIACILTNSSCADLETVCNQAGIYAGYKNKKEIDYDELIRAALEYKYGTNIEDINQEDNYAINTAYHEAGHALVGELLEPGSISFITITKNNSDTKGMTIFHENKDYWKDIKFRKNRIKSLLAGKAATEIVFNVCDIGTGSDLNRAYDIFSSLVDDYCLTDFNSHNSFDSSNKVKESRDDNVNKLISLYYQEVKDLLIKNREKLDNLAIVLKEKKILFQDEIENIING